MSPEVGFDPDGPGMGEGLFGLASDDDALIQVIPVPWEATTSYGRGTRGGPAAVLAASQQVDLHDLVFGDVYAHGIHLLAEDPRIAGWAAAADADAMRVIDSGGEDPEGAARVDALMDQMHAGVQARASALFAKGAIPAVLGGDHSVPYGLIAAAAERHPGLGVLHIDAHADLRDAYLGFRWSHASIMHNVMALDGIGMLVGVAYRDLARAERDRIEGDPRLVAFTDPVLARQLARGASWFELCVQIVDALPDNVHISCDIDGLDPSLCPSTGTPVPGGLSFRDLTVLLEVLAERRTITSFDLCEVAPGMTELDANIGARVLYRLAGATVASRADVDLGV